MCVLAIVKRGFLYVHVPLQYKLRFGVFNSWVTSSTAKYHAMNDLYISGKGLRDWWMRSRSSNVVGKCSFKINLKKYLMLCGNPLKTLAFKLLVWIKDCHCLYALGSATLIWVCVNMNLDEMAGSTHTTYF